MFLNGDFSPVDQKDFFMIGYRNLCEKQMQEGFNRLKKFLDENKQPGKKINRIAVLTVF
jgi:hypothetical protein